MYRANKTQTVLSHMSPETITTQYYRMKNIDKNNDIEQNAQGIKNIINNQMQRRNYKQMIQTMVTKSKPNMSQYP